MQIRSSFPFAKKGFVYLDSGATTQKPNQVLLSLMKSYECTANVHRGVYSLADEVTTNYESARKKVANFINAKETEIIFTKNATESINLVARSWGSVNVKKGDTILLTEMEHHSNIVPWQQLAKHTGAKVVFVPITKDGSLDVKKAKELIAKKPKIFALTHISNVLGTINPIKELVSFAKKQGVTTLIDAAQSIAHIVVDVKSIGCDFLVFSGHKMYGPHIGVLFGKEELLQKMPPFLSGGDMIKEVRKEGATWNDLPWKFEAGTPLISEAIALGAAIDFLKKIGMQKIVKHEQELTKYALKQLQKDKSIKIYGPKNRAGIISFNLGDMHAHDVSTVLDEKKICARSGHHCAQPLMHVLGIPACARISFGIYNTKNDVDKFMAAIKYAKKVFRL